MGVTPKYSAPEGFHPLNIRGVAELMIRVQALQRSLSVTLGALPPPATSAQAGDAWC